MPAEGGPLALPERWVLWYTEKQSGPKQLDNYEARVKPLGSFGTAEEFWSLYCHLVRPSKLPVGTDFHLFREGIKPMWEDEKNRAGGKLMIRIKKTLTNRLWEELLVGVVAGIFASDHVNGCVVSSRGKEDILALWSQSAAEDTKEALKRGLFRILHLPENTVIEYKDHDKSLQDNSGYANTVASSAGAGAAAK
jgi:translation initiation factor 4E